MMTAYSGGLKRMAIDHQTLAVGETVLSRFAEAIIARDYPLAHACFASWLQAQVSVEQLQGAMEIHDPD